MTDTLNKYMRKGELYDKIMNSLTSCPLCDLKEKFIITELDDVVLTMNIFGYIDGHMMVVPKKHIEKLSELTNTEMIASQKLISLAIQLINTELNIPNTNTLYREGNAAGNSLKHFHIHVMPITPEYFVHEGDKMHYYFLPLSMSPVEMATKLRRAIKTHGLHLN